LFFVFFFFVFRFFVFFFFFFGNILIVYGLLCLKMVQETSMFGDWLLVLLESVDEM